MAALSAGMGVSWQEKVNGVHGRQIIGNRPLFLLKPLTYMNRSGHSVSAFMQYFGIQNDEILVIHDDLELPFGTFSFKYSGGLGGHNGLRSISTQLGSRDFGRLRIGIGRPDHSNITAYVLGSFAKNEEEKLDDLFTGITSDLHDVLDTDFSDSNALNIKRKAPGF